jgi:hypothetical protein
MFLAGKHAGRRFTKLNKNDALSNGVLQHIITHTLKNLSNNFGNFSGVIAVKVTYFVDE